jgi:sigma-E factor negative regulatory protein RseA
MSTEANSASPGEQLSALLDGELPPEETDFLLKRLGRDAEARETLARYQLVGDTLRGERVRARPDFMLRVSAAIAAEPALEAPSRARGRTAGSGAPARWLRPVAGLGIAAAVASVAVFVMQRDPALPPTATVAGTTVPAPAATVAATAPAASTLAPSAVTTAGSLTGEPASYVTPPAMRGTGEIPAAQLASYVVAHSEFSSPLGRRNVLTGLVAGEPLAAPQATPQAGPVAPMSAAAAPVSELR